MTRMWKLRLVCSGLLVTLLCLGSGFAQEPKEVSQLYQMQHIRHDVANFLARQACVRNEVCRLQPAGSGFIELLASPEAHQRFAALLQEKDVPPATQVFQVHVLRGQQSGSTMPVLPQDAVAALEDLRQLLPFQGFELVDSGLMRTSEEARIFLGSERRYEARLRFRGDPASGKPLQIEFHLQTERWLPNKGDQGAQLHSLDLLDTTFGMSVGETVVVGTSKLNGGSEALVVLLTAGKS